MTELLQQLLNGLAWGALYAMIALGYTMVYGILRFINFAHGDVYMVGAMVGYYVSPRVPIANPYGKLLAVLGIAMACGALLGAAIERLAYRPLRNLPKLNTLITAIGVSLLLEYGGQYVFGADPKFFPQIIDNHVVFSWHGVTVNQAQCLIFGTTILLAVALHGLVRHTKLGQAMRAVSWNPVASQLMGISVSRVVTLTFMLGSALAAMAGILVGLSNPKIEPLMGLMPGLKAFVAAVLGGIGSIPGAMLGGLILGMTETLVSGYVSSTYRNAIAFALLILILLLKPEGLLGKKTVEKV